ncbi:MAG: DUF1566 domain-containing protein, partial [Gammaproteobacteria bacterium]|nr:DUF1566 domain-containing protein [Gammaproteobacteria bacterium]
TQGFADLVNAQGWCGANDWRLPDVDELLSIVDNSRVNPAIDIVYFPRTKSSSFWSSSPFAGYSSLACYVYVNYGNVYDGSKGGARSVRLVRGGQ